MSPDDTYLDQQAKAEEEKLQRKVGGLSDSERKDIYEKGLGLGRAAQCLEQRDGVNGVSPQRSGAAGGSESNPGRLLPPRAPPVRH